MIANLNGYGFFQSMGIPEVYMRLHKRDDGSIETRYAWDGDGIVRASLSEIAEAIDNAE